MLLTKDEVRTFEELTIQLCTYERNMTQSCSSSNTGQDDEALFVRPNRNSSNSSANTGFRKKPGNCNYCKKAGHWVRQCKKWHDDGCPKPPPKPEASSKNAQSNSVEAPIALVSIHNEVLAAELNVEDWFVDNGATRHVTNRSDWFCSFQKFADSCSIGTAGDERLVAAGSGTIEVTSTVKGKSQRFMLKDVWLVPKIARNLFSPLSAHDKNPNSMFESTVNSCVFSVNGSTVLTGTREQYGTLYQTNMKSVPPENKSTVNVAESSDMLQLYHERWGHQNKQHIKKKLEKELDLKVKLDNKICEPCVYGKAHRLPFGTRKPASAPGELISADVCGPFYKLLFNSLLFVRWDSSLEVATVH